MKPRICRVLLAVTILVSFSGCPQATAILLGEWEFQIFVNGDPFGNPLQILLLQGGLTATPQGATTFFNGSLAWEQVGNDFMMTQITDLSVLDFSGTVRAENSMDGNRVLRSDGSLVDTWVATYVGP